MTGPSHREPLDEDERELARVLRALPASEPSSALDQRILRAAADAGAAPRRPVRHWLAFGGASWGIGGAAAAVLALGVSWHLIDPTRNLPMERSAPMASAQSEDAVTVTLAEPAAFAGDAASTTETNSTVPALAPDASADNPPRLRVAPARSRAAIPAPAAAPVVAPPVAPPPPPSPEPFTDTSGAASEAVELGPVESAASPPVASLEDSVQLQSQRAEARESDSVAAERQAKAADEAAKARTGAMTPAVWLAQVRSLRDAQRRAEAADSLRRFRQYYPQYAIPADLLPLLRE